MKTTEDKRILACLEDEPDVASEWNAAIRAAAFTARQNAPDECGGPFSHTNTMRVLAFDIEDAILALLRQEDHIADTGKMVEPPTVAEAARVLVDPVRALLEWDAARKYPIPYRVRDPLIAALRALAGEGKP